MRSLYLGLAAGLLGASASPAALTVHTTSFISSPVATNDLEGATDTVFVNTPYTQGGITLQYVSAVPDENAGGYIFEGLDLGDGTHGAYAIGYHGYAAIKLASGDAFNQIQFSAASGGGTQLFYDLYLNGASVAAGVAGGVNADFAKPLTYGFSGLTFDEVRLRTTNPGSSGTQDTLALDNLAIGIVSDAPEPATWALMLVGFGAIGTSLRSKRARVSCA